MARHTNPRQRAEPCPPVRRAAPRSRRLPHIAPARLLLVATRATATNESLVSAFGATGVHAMIVQPNEALRTAGSGDLALGRLDVLPSLVGPEPGVWALRSLERRGVRVLNDARAHLACHDKLATALLLARAGIAHPRTAYVDESTLPSLDGPVVVKPRFGSGGRGVRRCESSAELACHLGRQQRERWFRRHGALVQECVLWSGFELRLVVAAGEVVGASALVGEQPRWTSTADASLRARSIRPPSEACETAIRAAQAAGTALAVVELLPLRNGAYTVLELDPAGEFGQAESLGAVDIFHIAAMRLAAAAQLEKEGAWL